MAQWIGYMVSIKCGDNGAYQGEIQTATTAQITLAKAFCNGIPCPQNEVTIRASDIQELKLIDKQTTSPQQRSTITIAKPIAKRAGRTQSTSEAINSTPKYTNNANLNGSHAKSKPIDIETKNTSLSFNPFNEASFKSGTPNKRDRSKGKWAKGWKDEECFGSPLDPKIDKDFDFEKNLALFDKQAIWDEINNSQKPDVIKNIDSRKPSKYRHDENVITATPATYRQIVMPKQDFCEYVTDDGLIIPSISKPLRKKLWELADAAGLTWEKRVELMGRAAAEISIQLLGGGHRLNPHNSHQFPKVVVLCGSHQNGAVGINAARQLSSHGVHTVVYTPAPEVPVIKKELILYNLTKNPVISTVAKLPNFTDLIIVALCEDGDHAKIPANVTEWVSKNKAPVLALDPPSDGTPGLIPKFSLCPMLPLPHSPNNGKLYLCNLGFPLELFRQVGIKYKSPFGPKFIIPLHPSEE